MTAGGLMAVRHEQTLWFAFGGLVIALLALDLLVLNRRAHVLTVREALRWTIVVVGAALGFGLAILAISGPASALEYYAGYLIELSLSVDNLFVFLLIFQYFAVPAEAQRRVLSWGIFGAMVLRGAMVLLGTIVISRYEWVIYVFGGILLVTAVKMFRDDDIRIEPEKNPIVRFCRRVIPMANAYEGEHFFIKAGARTLATPLLLVLIIVEQTDVVFAIDSIPAIFAITRDPFIVFSSNILAIIGLRAMFFVLADAMERFAYLKPGVAIILGFVGLKMILSRWVHLPTGIALGVIIVILAAAVVLSIRKDRREHPAR
jgi:tellurite resistance protein TerC